MIKAILFDFDGTVVDSLAAIHNSWVESYKRLGKHLTDKEIIDTYYTTKERIKENHGIDPDKLLDYFHEIFDIAILEVKEQENLRGALMKLKENEIKTAIISFGNGERIKNYLKSHDLDNYFELVLGREDVVEQKPDPEIAEKAMKALGVTADETMIIGDAALDIQTGKNAGTLTAFFHPEHNRLYTDMDLFRDIKADIEFSDFAEFFEKTERFF